jgi:hypothetical protein
MEMDDQGFAGIGKGFNNLDGLVFQFSPLTSVTLSNVIPYICLHTSPLVCTFEDHLPDVKLTLNLIHLRTTLKFVSCILASP